MEFPPQTALVSVSDKRGLIELCRELWMLANFRFISTGGTARALTDAKLHVTTVADVTGFNEMMDGLVKTLHPRVHGGILAKNTGAHRAELEANGAPRIHLVVVNLYPFQETIAKAGTTRTQALDNEDMGGVALLRSACKGEWDGAGEVFPVCDPDDYPAVVAWYKAGCPDAQAFRRKLVDKARAHIAAYIGASTEYFSEGNTQVIVGEKIADLAYGENRSWKAAVYGSGKKHPLAFDSFKQVGGKPPGYVNVTDLERETRLLSQVVVTGQQNHMPWSHVTTIVKHGNPCGVGVGMTSAESIMRAIDGNQLAAHGGFLECNFGLSRDDAHLIRSYGKRESEALRMLDGVVAVEYDEGVEEILDRKTKMCRMLVNPHLANIDLDMLPREQHRMLIGRRLIRQWGEPFILRLDDPRMEKIGPVPSEQALADMLLAYAICQRTNSNSSVLVFEGAQRGAGLAQPSRVETVEVANKQRRRHHPDLKRQSGATDSFPPYRDAIDEFHEGGTDVVFATKGGMNHEQVKQAALELRITLWRLEDEIARAFDTH